MAEKLSDVANFLRDRGVSEVINLMEEQKIDKDIITLMEDAELANYLPSYGDRIALSNFCRRQTPSSKRKLGLFEKLREKLKLRKEKDKVVGVIPAQEHLNFTDMPVFCTWIGSQAPGQPPVCVTVDMK